MLYCLRMVVVEHYIVTEYGMLKVHPAVVKQMEGVRRNKDGSYDRRSSLGKRFAEYEQNIIANAWKSAYKRTHYFTPRKFP
jgi:hypothetical protein